jgi:hypothetical protein
VAYSLAVRSTAKLGFEKVRGGGVSFTKHQCSAPKKTKQHTIVLFRYFDNHD